MGQPNPEPVGMTPPDTSPASEVEQLPRHTTPTWEVELLISGAAVFAMLQLPGWLGDHLLPLIPRFVAGLGTALWMLFEYLTFTAIILAVTFALHLILRAYWIALVGLHSVFPDGVRWERLRIGQILRDFARQQDHGADNRIEHADNRATVVFAFGVTYAMVMLSLGIAALLAFAITIAIDQVGNRQVNALYVFLAVFGLFALPLFAAMGLDRIFGRRMRSDGKPRRLLTRVFAIYGRLGVVPGLYTFRLLESHVGSRRFQLLSAMVIAPLTIIVLAIMLTWGNPLSFGSYALFPHFANQNSHAIAAVHYDDERDPAQTQAVPYIQSEVVTDPYVKLVVPYSPQRDDAALRHSCPAMHAAHSDRARANAALACLTTLHPVSLDGKPLITLHYDAASDPRSNRPALQAMIDVRSLTPGRHELRVARTPPAPGSHDHDKAKAWIIPFWR